MKSYLGNYEDFLNKFLKRGYEISPLENFTGAKRGALVLRHDIDLDCSLARKISEIEHKLGVKASYFFMLRSDSYNLLSSGNWEHVKSIKSLGHTISLHFDPVIYSDFKQGFKEEKNIFERIFDTEVKIASLHRPNDFFLNYDKPIQGVVHTYQRKFFKEIKYISDSRGSFRFGHPFDSEEWKNKDSIHLLTHPIWWAMSGTSNIDSLNKLIKHRSNKFSKHVADTCIPYKQYIEKK